jgi:hypothetical protein
MGTQSNSMGPSMSHAASSCLLLLLLQRLNWVHFSWMHKKLKYCD